MNGGNGSARQRFSRDQTQVFLVVRGVSPCLAERVIAIKFLSVSTTGNRVVGIM